MLSAKQLKQLKSQLPKNYITKILDVLLKKGIETSKPTVSRTLNGLTDRTDIIEAALIVSKDHQKRLNKIKSKIN